MVYFNEAILLFYSTIFTFYKQNPDWQIKFYYPKQRSANKPWLTFEHRLKSSEKHDSFTLLEKLPIEFIEYDFNDIGLENNLPEVHKSDFLRWHLLSTDGGLWSDIDIIYYKPMSVINCAVEQEEGLDTFLCRENINGWYLIGFLLGSKNNSFFRYIYRIARRQYKTELYQSVGQDLFTNNFPTIESIKEAFPELHVLNMPLQIVYPFMFYDTHKIYKEIEMGSLIKQTIGLHWFGGDSNASKYINEITYKNCRKLNNTLSKVISTALD